MGSVVSATSAKHSGRLAQRHEAMQQKLIPNLSLDLRSSDLELPAIGVVLKDRGEEVGKCLVREDCYAGFGP